MTTPPIEHEFSHVRFVSAGAGSGKTYKLTAELQKAVVDDGVDPARIIATTFTVKAASELRERVRSRLIEAGRPALAEQMAQALVGTVHAVCERLLKRFAFELGLSPVLHVLAQDDGARLLRGALDEVLDISRVREMNALARQLSLVGKTGPLWQDHVRTIVDAARSNDIDPLEFGQMGRTSADRMLAFFDRPASVDPAGLDRAVLSALELAVREIGAIGTQQKGSLEYLDTARSALRDFRRGEATWLTWMRLASGKAGKKDRTDTFAAPVRDAAAAYTRHPRFHRDLRGYIEGVFDIGGGSLDRFQAHKRARGLIDFPDMEQYTLRALDEPAVIERLENELDVLLVDEFQDTNPMQLALFMKLARVAKRVVFVGDVKQAVFEFRGCDPELVFSTLRALERGGAGSEVLELSYRSRPALVHYVNEVFAPAFVADGLTRDKVVLKPVRNEHTTLPAVVSWRLPAKTEDSLLARAIGELVASGYPVIDPESNLVRPVRFGDIALLTPTNKQVETLARALQAERVPMKMTIAGLLLTSEIQLAKSCLRRLNDPSDTLATAMILSLAHCQEPEVWLTDRLRWLDRGERSWEWAETTDPVIGKLRMLREEIATQSPVEIVARVLNYVGVREFVTRWGPDAAKVQQRQRNLDAFLELAVQYENRCRAQHEAATLSGFLLWSEAPVSPELDLQPVVTTGDAVHIATYHKSKGLEWPVVVVNDLFSVRGSQLFGVRVEAHTPHFDVSNPLAGRAIRFWPDVFGGGGRKSLAPLDAMLVSPEGSEGTKSAAAERRRVHYVGLTRARDLLIIPFHKPDGGDILLPTADSFELPDGTVIPTALRTLIDDGQPPLDDRPFAPLWFEERTPLSKPLDELVRPSDQIAVGGGFVREAVELGPRITIRSEDMNVVGNAIHTIVAAELVNPSKRDAVARAARVLAACGATDLVSPDDTIAAARRFSTFVKQRFAPKHIRVEYPLTRVLENGQVVSGFADVLLETAEGWVVIDHKSSPRPRSEWAQEAQKYSGQLAAYADALSAAGHTVHSTWIHFPVTGGMVEVCSAEGSDPSAEHSSARRVRQPPQ